MGCFVRKIIVVSVKMLLILFERNVYILLFRILFIIVVKMIVRYERLVINKNIVKLVLELDILFGFFVVFVFFLLNLFFCKFGVFLKVYGYDFDFMEMNCSYWFVCCSLVDLLCFIFFMFGR